MYTLPPATWRPSEQREQRTASRRNFKTPATAVLVISKQLVLSLRRQRTSQIRSEEGFPPSSGSMGVGVCLSRSPSLVSVLTLSRLAIVTLAASVWLRGPTSADSMAVGQAVHSPRYVLVFGGNGFLGGATVERLLAARHRVVTVHRGNWYWDSAFVIKPYVTHIKCDRMSSLDKCPQLLDLVNNNGSFDAVVDFSAYHPFSIKEALKVLKDKARFYIYISTDSVYDVCDKSHADPTRESDAVRPASEQRRQELQAVESYGHRKLMIEEELVLQREAGGIPFVSLRLPDVIGPKDNTYRWWIYQLWMRLADHLEKPLAIPSFLVNKPMSLVYVNDVADVIVRLMDPKPEVFDQAFNLAFKETPTLLQLLGDMKLALNITDLSIITDNSVNAVHMFPSVRSGPIDVTKAQESLHWSPTPLETAIVETVDFYERTMTDPYMVGPRKEIIRTMETHFTSKPLMLLQGLKKHYGLNYQVPKEEL